MRALLPESLLYVIIKGILFAAFVPATIAVLKDGHFVFTSFEQAPDIFLMCKKHQHSHCDSKDPVEFLRLIKNYQYENRECNACQDGT